MNSKINRAAEAALEKLAAILDAVENDYTDAAHKSAPGTKYERSRVILGAVCNAREHLTSDFLALLDDARDALDDYNRAVNDFEEVQVCEA